MPLFKAVAFVAGLGLSMLSYPVHATPAGSGDTVQEFYDALLGTIKNGRTTGSKQSFHATGAGYSPQLRHRLDGAVGGRPVLGQSDRGAARAGHRGLWALISASYADRFDSYAGQKLEVTGEQPPPSGVIVRSQIIKANGEPVKVDYMMRRNGEGWLISDIYLDGAISEVATRRSEFAAILKKEGIDGLIAALNRKADILTVTTARSF
jgi:phospholipid transport system substrate-binding protein